MKDLGKQMVFVLAALASSSAFAGPMVGGGPEEQYAARSHEVFQKVLSALNENGLAVDYIKSKSNDLVAAGVACNGNDVRELDFSVTEGCLDSIIPGICRPSRDVNPVTDISMICR